MAGRTLTAGRQLLSDILPSLGMNVASDSRKLLSFCLSSRRNNLLTSQFHSIKSNNVVKSVSSGSFQIMKKKLLFNSQLLHASPQDTYLAFTKRLLSSQVFHTNSMEIICSNASKSPSSYCGLPISRGTNALFTQVMTGGGVTLLSGTPQNVRNLTQGRGDLSSIHNRISSLQAKKRVQRKKKQAPAESDEVMMFYFICNVKI